MDKYFEHVSSIGDTDTTSPQEATNIANIVTTSKKMNHPKRKSAQEGTIHLLVVMAMKGSAYCPINQWNSSSQQAGSIKVSSVTCFYNSSRRLRCICSQIQHLEWACKTSIHAHTTKVLQVCATLLCFPLVYIATSDHS